MPAFEKVPTQPDLPQMEERILAFWDEIDAFAESNRRRAEGGDYVFYDGPPFATGTPHYGHLLAGTIKDIVPRYWNMRGHRVERRFGWDCHGLPIEALAQEALGLAGTGAIRDAGIDVFNEQCRSMVQTYVAEWRKTVTRMGRWVDFDDDYKTMDASFMESVWWVFKRLWEQGRIYRAHRIMPYSWALTTPLSNFEANSNYRDVQDPAITVACRITSDHGLGEAAGSAGEVSFLIWTTTPWTLPENLALCAGPDIDYVAAKDAESGAIYILAEARLGAYYKSKDQYDIVARYTGSELAGWTYEPLFPYFADQPNAFVVLTDGFVSTGDGTGIVHMAPAYGEDDYRVCRAAGIDLVDPLDDEARFTDQVPDYAGQFVKDADKAIIKRLKDEGKLVHQGQITHSYPFCERTDTPLIYRAIDAWYVRVEDLRDQLVANNDSVTWVPEYVGEKRFGNWLKDAKDWNISRNRFWGSCLPVWINVDDPDDMLCVGSIDELEQLSGVKVDDLHKHVVDEVVIERNGKTYRRTPEVLDCWFESGAMPYAQQHYPFAREGEESSFFPAHFIAEGLDQTRGWFYTLLILGTCLFGRSPYRNVVVNGMILAEDGSKMSKRKKNYPDPGEVLDRYGADALRAYLIDSPVVRGEKLQFSEKGLQQIVKTVVLPYWNALAFFTTYAEIEGYDPRDEAWRVAPSCDDDRWILSVLQSLVRDVNHEMEGYRLYNVVPRLVSFIDDLTNWYIRANRGRFWRSDDRGDQAAALGTLYRVLTTFAQVLAPFMPFVTETVYQKLVRPVDADAPESIHWCDYPQVDERLIDAALEHRVATVRAAVTLGRKLREDHKLKTRQPLLAITVVHRDAAVRADAEAAAATIERELNVKSLSTEADESAYVTVAVKPNFQTLRARCAPKLGAIGKVLKGWGFDEVARLEAGEAIEVEGETIALDDVLLQRSAVGDAVVATDGHMTVVLDPRVTPELEREGIANEFKSRLQAARKDAGLAVTDRIAVIWTSPSDKAAQALREHGETIAAECLATSFAEGDAAGASEVEVNGEAVVFALAKA